MGKMNKPGAVGGPRLRYIIHDRAGLAQLIRDKIRRDYNGNLSEAAREIDVNQPELYRLSKAKLGAIGFKVLSRLRKLFREQIDEFERTVMSPLAQEFLAAYHRWLKIESNFVYERESLGDTEIGRATEALIGWEYQRLLEAQALLKALRLKFPELFNRFDTFLVQRAHYRDRGELAYTRIIAPLLDSRESGFVERRWQEMSNEELRKFVKAGMDRERILLRRSPDVQRAQQAAERDPVELMTLYGQMMDARAAFGRRSPPLLKRYVRMLAGR